MCLSIKNKNKTKEKNGYTNLTFFGVGAFDV